jgi:hypothetical protein
MKENMEKSEEEIVGLLNESIQAFQSSISTLLAPPSAPKLLLLRPLLCVSMCVEASLEN